MANSSKSPTYNVVFMGNIGYPDGMAGTKRVQHAIDLLKDHGHRTAVLQSHLPDRKQNPSSGINQGTPYKSLNHPSLLPGKFGTIVSNQIQAFSYLKKWYQPNQANFIYHYKRPITRCIFTFFYARSIGYHVLLDFTEDIRHASRLSNNVTNQLKKWYSTFLQKRTPQLVDGVFTVSQTLQTHFRNLCGKRIPVKHRPISVNMSRFSSHKNESFHNPVRILYSGSFAQKDGVENLIVAFDAVVEQFPDVILILTGQGKKPRMNKIRQLIEQCAHSDKIKMTGYLPKETYYQTINESDIACVPRINSPYAEAGFPFKLGEYLAAGLPTLVSRVSDVEHYLNHKKNAFLIQPGSVESITNGLAELLDNPDQARRIGSEGRKIAERHFSRNAQKTRFYEMLQSVIKKG